MIKWLVLSVLLPIVCMVPTTRNGGWCAFQDKPGASCSQDCGGGTIEQVRICNCPALENGGDDCTGVATQDVACNTDACPADVWSEWTDWGVCSERCGNGHQERSRTCENQQSSCVEDGELAIRTCVCDDDVDENTCAAITDGILYLADPCDCSRFYQCEPTGATWRVHHMNCSECTEWDMVSKTCGIQVYDCGVAPSTSDSCFAANKTVHKKSHATNDKKYLWFVNNRWLSMPCPTGTIFALANCTCIHDPSHVSPAISKELSCFGFNGSYEGSKHMYASSDSTTLKNDTAYFAGSGFVAIPFFSGGYYYNGFSASLWFKRTTSAATGAQGLLYNGHCTGSASIAIMSDTQDQISASIKTQGGDETVTVTSVVFGTWHHVVLVYNGVRLTVYVDNQAHHSAQTVSGLISQRFCSLWLGSAGAGQGFTGFMDEVCLYSAPLSEAEVQAAYDAGHNGEN